MYIPFNMCLCRWIPRGLCQFLARPPWPPTCCCGAGRPRRGAPAALVAQRPAAAAPGGEGPHPAMAGTGEWLEKTIDPNRFHRHHENHVKPMVKSMGTLESILNGGTVPYFQPYFGGTSPYISLA